VKAVFLDTVGLLALWDIADQWHYDAEQAFAVMKAERRFLITTSFIFLECGNAAARRPYRNQVDSLRQKMALRGELIIPTETDWENAWQAYQSGKSGQAGIVDQVSFIVMRRLKITEAFTNDRHFQAAGFKVLF